MQGQRSYCLWSWLCFFAGKGKYQTEYGQVYTEFAKEIDKQNEFAYN